MLMLCKFTFFVCGVRVGGEGEPLLISLMSEVSVSSDSLVVPALVFPFLTGGFLVDLLATLTADLFLELVLCLEACFASSNSLSDSVSTKALDLLRPLLPFRTGLAVADFLGTTFGLGGLTFLAAEAFFLEAAASLSVSSSLIGLGFALAFVTKPDFLFTTDFSGFFLFLSVSDVSFLFGLLVVLL